ncbi:MAG: right-handed parallel beta-helix repeat-containing protein, partial [Sphingomonas sp.]
MATINVSSTTGLLAALRRADDGDVIRLAAGTYDDVDIRNVRIDGNVTITSADARNPAVVTDLTMRNSSGLTLSRLELAAGPRGDVYGFEVLNSSAITLDRLDVHGTMNDDPTDDKSLLLIRGSRDVTVANSEFQQGWHGISHLDSEDVRIVNNSFHDLRTDGVRGGGTSDLVISGNYFTDFHPAAGDHPDAIQLWTTNTDATARDITIADNLIVRGDGAAVQGIFIRDTFMSNPWADVTITGNTVLGSLYNALTIGNVDGLTVSDNRVVAYEGQTAWLRVGAARDAEITNNEATDLIINEAPGAVRRGTVEGGRLSANGLAAVTRLLAGKDGPPGGLKDRVDSLLDQQLTAYAVIDGTDAEKAETAAGY